MAIYMLCAWVFATIPLNPSIKIPVVFSSSDMNRLSLKNGRIKQVFGADLFDIEKDEETGQIFMHVKEDVSLPDAMSMAFVTDDGMTQDINVSFEEGTSTSVVFHMNKKRVTFMQAAKHFLYDVLSGNIKDYVRQDEGKSYAWSWAKIQFKHRFVKQKFAVEIYELTGENPCCLYHLKPAHFLNLTTQICGIHLSNSVLKGRKPVILTILKRRK